MRFLFSFLHIQVEFKLKFCNVTCNEITQISLQEGELDSSTKSIQEVVVSFLDSKIDFDAFL